MKKSTFKKIMAIVLSLTMLVASAISTLASASDFVAEDVAVENNGLTQNQINIAARGDYMYSLTWYCHQTISACAYGSGYTFYAGNTYHMPYGQGNTSHYIGYGVTPESFVNAANTAGSVFYTNKSYINSSWYSAYYIQDCSGFVSWCWGLSVKQSTRSLANYSTYVASIGTSNINNYLQVGDALNRYDYHVVLVTDLQRDSNGNITMVEITEQTIPQTERTYYYSASALASAYSSYDGIYRYNGSDGAVPEAPFQVKASDTNLEGASPVNLGDDFYAYVKQSSTGLYLTNNNGNVCVANGLDNGTQKWRFVRQSNGAYSLSPDGATYWMDVTNQKYENGTNIQAAVGNGNDSQKFYIYYIGREFYLKSMYDNRMVDVATANGNVQLFGQESNYTNRAFEIYKVSFDYDPWSDAVGENFECFIRNSSSDLFLTAEGDNAIFKYRDYSDAQTWIITKNQYGGHVIKSKLTGKVLDVASASLDSYANIDLYTDNGSKAQSFFFIHAGESRFYIKPSYTNTVIDMDSSTHEIHSMPYGTSDTQKNAQIFEIISDHHIGEDMVLRPSANMGTSFYGQLISEHTEYALTDMGSYVVMAENTFADNQIWKFELDSKFNAYKITGSSGKVLDVTGAYYSDGTSISLWESNDTPSQRFRFYEDNWGYLISPAHTQKVIDIESMDNKTVQLYGSCPNDVRLFSVKHISYNEYKPVDFGESFVSSIKNTASGLFIGGNASGVVSGGASADKWKFTRQSDGSYIIENVNAKKVLDIKSGSIQSGAEIQLYESNGTGAQKFFIYEGTNGGYVFMSAKNSKVIDMDASTKIFHIHNWGTSDLSIAAQTFELTDAPESQNEVLTLKDTSSYLKAEAFVTEIKAGDTISHVIAQFINSGIQITDAKGSVISQSAECGTGYNVLLVKDKSVVDSLIAVVSGDVDGNCKIDSTDYLRIKSVFLGTMELDGAYFLAADMDDNGKIDATDYLKIKSIFLGIN